jgi:hypothetical protein
MKLVLKNGTETLEPGNRIHTRNGSAYNSSQGLFPNISDRYGKIDNKDNVPKLYI